MTFASKRTSLLRLAARCARKTPVFIKATIFLLVLLSLWSSLVVNLRFPTTENDLAIRPRYEDSHEKKDATPQPMIKNATAQTRTTSAAVATKKREDSESDKTKHYDGAGVNDPRDHWWDAGSRIIGNSAVNMTHPFVKKMIADYLKPETWPFILQRTLCEPSSRFCHFDTRSIMQKDNHIDTRKLEAWADRLLYMLVHHNQHRHARTTQALERLSAAANVTNDNDYDKTDQAIQAIGLFDFSCPDAKFLVVAGKSYGLGAHVRHIYLAMLTAGLYSGRVVLFVNSVSALKETSQTWGWASCDRRDAQCVFLPLSPCVLTEEELKNAAVVPSSAILDTQLQQDHRRILVLKETNNFWKYEPPSDWIDVVSRLAHELVQQMETTLGLELSVLRQAARYFERDKRMQLSKTGAQHHPFAQTPLARAIVAYALRPNIYYHAQLDAKMTHIFPNPFYPHRSFGLPIRGTDKCERESQCLDFDKYMQLAMQQYNKGIFNESPSLKLKNETLQDSSSTPPIHLILTSEDPGILSQHIKYEANSTFPFSFIVDKEGVSPESGHAGSFSANEVDADQAVFSSLAVIKMHLKARHVIANCCSNFHNVILDMLRLGCGVVENVTTECLYDNEDPQFQVCCGKLLDHRCEDEPEKVANRGNISDASQGKTEVVSKGTSNMEEGQTKTMAIESQSEPINWKTTGYSFKGTNSDTNFCALTVVLVDPRIPGFLANDTFYTHTLESVAEYVPANACIVLQTSVCYLRQCMAQNVAPDQVHYLEAETVPLRDRRGSGHATSTKSACSGLPVDDTTNNNNNNKTVLTDDDSLLSIVHRLVWQRSGLHLSKFFDRGRVRVSILNHTKYHLAACDFFSPLNFLFLSASYWIDEFLPQDSDKVLIVQRDVYLCKHLKVSTWGHFDYVGSPWANDWPWMKIAYEDSENQYINIRPERKREASIETWQKYFSELEKHHTGDSSTNQSCDSMTDLANNIHCPLPNLGDDLTFPTKLPERSYWVGNGGFSLRSRKWMVRMVRLCPSVKASNLAPDLVKSAVCSVNRMQEDMFFSLMLTLVGARIASLEEAVFFGTDQDFLWPNDVLANNRRNEAMIQNELGVDFWRDFQRETEEIGHALPIGQHKCWLSFKNRGNGCVEKRWCKYSFNMDQTNFTNMDDKIES